MAALDIANLKKTIYYLRRNGLKNTWKAAMERLEQRKDEPYVWQPLTKDQWKTGRERSLELIREARKAGKKAPAFSILVPAYRTDPRFLGELVKSLLDQTYPLWELLILDASEDNGVRDALREFCGREEVLLSEESPESAGDAAFRPLESRLPFEKTPESAGDAIFRPLESRVPFEKTPESAAEKNGSAGGCDGQFSLVRYVRLSKNGGISENTNAGLPLARGEYIGLLDHDDVLTADALQCMAEVILGQENIGEMGDTCQTDVKLLYSDEDKWNGEENGFYEPNFKEDFNLDLLLSNNYICHFLVLERELFRELKLRKEYDGAQDYDLVLRAAERLGGGAAVRHIPKVLYHWRCHSASTAENPRSKTYAYEAGRRALQDYADRNGLNARAVNLKHVGFYRLEYLPGEKPVLRQKPERGTAAAVQEPENSISEAGQKFERGTFAAGQYPERGTSSAEQEPGDMTFERLSPEGAAPKSLLPPVLLQRPDLGAVGGRVTAGKDYRPSPREQAAYPEVRLKKGCLVGGRMDFAGRVYYYGLKPGYSGYLHRAVLTQDAEAVDIRCICVAEDCRKLFEETTGISYVTRPGSQWFDSSVIPAEADVAQLSLRFGQALRQQGRRILWDPGQEGSEI